jgi:hypothetical protein
MTKCTFRGIHAILSGAFEAAIRWEWMDRNPGRLGQASHLQPSDHPGYVVG